MPRRVFGYTLDNNNKKSPVELYVRLHIGYGDAIMLRPAIIANMKRYPDKTHIIHSHADPACIYKDIENLIIVPIKQPFTADREVGIAWRRTQSNKISYNYWMIDNIYYLSSPCADYETENAPYKRVRRKSKSVVIPTGNQIYRSRQSIFCEVVGVDFDVNNYNVSFYPEELEYARSVLPDKEGVVGIQLKTSTFTRDYDRMSSLVDYIAKRVRLVAITDYNGREVYRGHADNVEFVGNANIRYTWAAISRLSLFVGTDSFGIHAAGSLGVPTYGIFGPTNPRCRLSHYKVAAWNDRFNLPILRRGLKRGCGRQYCWYQPCESRLCINYYSPEYYWKDIQKKLGGRINV